MDNASPDPQPREEQIVARIRKPLTEQRRQKFRGKFKPLREGKITLKIQAALPELPLEEARRRGLWLLFQSLENGWDKLI